MKTIIYFLLAVIITGIVATSFTSIPATKQTILLQSSDNKISSIQLSQSADKISKRLESYTNEKFVVNIISEKDQIEIVVDNNLDLKVLKSLVTQKGEISLYETYDYQSLLSLLKGDTTLKMLMHVVTPHQSSPNIGCVSTAEMNQVNEYLNAARLDGKCCFVWSNLFDNSNNCLYALRMAEENRIPLSGHDIQSFEAKQEKERCYIDFKFKQPAVKVWADVTKRNLNKSIAIVMDNNVLYAPYVTSEINGGNCQISGRFTYDEGRYIAAIGIGGVLPIDFKIVK